MINCKCCCLRIVYDFSRSKCCFCINNCDPCNCLRMPKKVEFGDRNYFYTCQVCEFFYSEFEDCQSHMETVHCEKESAMQDEVVMSILLNYDFDEFVDLFV